jgi:hypothetical protein
LLNKALQDAIEQLPQREGDSDRDRSSARNDLIRDKLIRETDDIY